MEGCGRWQRAVLCAATGISTLGGSPTGLRAQPAQPLAYRSGVELVTVDVNVVDRRGNPVPHLGPDQFEVTIDGKPRRVVSAEFLEYAGTDAQGETWTGPATAASRVFSTNEAGGQASSPGRLVVLAVDQGSFRAFGARAAMEAARRFIDRLRPADRVGFVTFPPPGPQLAPSRDHTAARELTARIVGTATPFSAAPSTVQVSLAEALDIRAGDRSAFDRVMRRECAGASGLALQACGQSVEMEAGNIAVGAELQASRSLSGLEAVVRSLAAQRERKTLVLVSAGLPVSDRIGGDLQLTQRVAELGRLAAAANLNLYVLYVDSSFLDAFSASERGPGETFWRDTDMLGAGLETIAGASGGSLVRIVAGADSAFDRVLRETSAAYLLGVEPDDTERDGRTHRIGVKVRLPDVEVRSRREVFLPKVLPPPASPEEALADVLQSPRAATGLPLRVSTFIMAGETPGALRVLVAAEIGTSRASPEEMRVAYVVADAAGEVRASAGQRLALIPRKTSGTGALSYLAAVTLRPGTYTLRLAASDPDGKIGSVEHPFAVGLAEGQGIHFGDLLLLDPLRTRDEPSAPVADGELLGRSVDAYVEARPASAQSAVTGVTFGVSDSPAGAPLIALPVAVTRKDAKSPWAAAGRLDLGPLPPGDYTAFASITSGTQVLGRATRPLRIGRAAPPATGARTASLAPRVSFSAGVSGSLIKAFSPASVLQPDALTYFLGRLASTDQPGSSTPASRAAADAIRRGSYDEALVTLSAAPADQLAATFLSGLALFGKGELEPAAAKFVAALSHTPDFLPAVFYLGACYAAGGRDREAAGAWQAALISEAEARIVYDVLGDALLRLRDAEQADDLLAEAGDRWAGDEGFVPRMAVAKVLLGRHDEALALLEPFIAKNPDDAEAIFLALRLLYERVSAGGSASPANTAAAERYAALYRQAGGSAVPLVDRWLAFMKKR